MGLREGDDRDFCMSANEMVQEADLKSILFISSFKDFLSNLSSPLDVQVRYYSVDLGRGIRTSWWGKICFLQLQVRFFNFLD
jgi:hypothetical protein